MVDQKFRVTMRLFVPSVLLLLLGSPEIRSAPTSDEGIGGTINRADVGAVSEINRHDAHALAARYWNDAIDVTPAGVVKGQTEIERRFAEEFETSDPRDFAEHFDEVDFSGDLGWLVGHWSETRIGADGSRHPVGGNVVAVLERRDGQWKARVHVITVTQ
jgi:ketosteroid isomerase-like protein